MARVVEELGRLVAYPTVSNRPLLELAAHLAQRAEDLGFRIERFVPPGPAGQGKCTVIASTGPEDVGPEDSSDGLVMSGHMDVVPTEGQPWSSDPFRVVERQGRLYGRGTADMKGFIAATYEGLARIERSAYKKRLVLIWTHDEEVGCMGSAGLVQAMEGRPFPAACWIGEPTEFHIQRMHPGHVGVEIVVGGRAAHSSRPDLGLNAIEGAARVIEAIRAWADELAQRRADLPEMERPTVAVNVAEISGGAALNIVPDRCVVRIGYRQLPGQDPLALWHELEERLAALGLPQPVHGHVLRVTPSLLTRTGTPLQPWLTPHAATERCSAATFATDGGNLARLGMEPLIFGPGSISVAHQADEYVPTDELVRTVDMVESVVRRACS
jgi:acetylornithine deacetylase